MNIYGIMYIGGDNMNQIELNRKLYNEFEKEKLNESRIIELLKQGANPLGNMSNNKHSEKPYEEILYENKNLDKITGLLLENGMVIDNKDYQNNDMINPLWELALRTDTIGIKTLKLLLDNKTEVDSIEVFVDHIYTDYILLGDKEKMAKQAVENNEIEVETGKVETYYSIAMKMLMLCASYDYVLDNSEYIKDIIDYDRNNKNNINFFKNYNNIYIRETQKELRFYRKRNNNLVWTILY